MGTSTIIRRRDPGMTLAREPDPAGCDGAGGEDAGLPEPGGLSPEDFATYARRYGLDGERRDTRHG